MERKFSTPAKRRRGIGAVRAMLHPLELAPARTGLEAECGELASVPELAATRHKVVGRRRRRRWWRGVAAYGERGRRRLARDDGDGHGVCARQLAVRRQSRQRDFMVARLEA